MRIKSFPWVATCLASVVVGVAGPLQAIPFDPLPSGFQRWLNAQRGWPGGQQLTFSHLAQCSDQTLPVSPYQMPAFTCLKGDVRYSGGGKPSQVCQLRRITYFPANKKVRIWKGSCSPPS